MHALYCQAIKPPDLTAEVSKLAVSRGEFEPPTGAAMHHETDRVSI